MLNAQISHVALDLPDLEAGRRFYEKVVGLVAEPGAEGASSADAW